MSFRSRGRAAGAALAALVALSACQADATGEGAGAGPEVATELPDNLCQTVPADFVCDWQLEETAHETTPGDDTAQATCTMTGTRNDQPVTLEIEATTFAPRDDASASDRATSALEDQCETLRSGPLPEVEVEVNRCAATSDATADGGGHVIDMSRLPTEGALLVVDLDAPGEQTSSVEFDVTGLATGYLSEGLLTAT